MKEHGLLFSAPMIRARAAGLKTQTRRIITPYNCTIDGKRPGKAGLPDIYRKDNSVKILSDGKVGDWLSVIDPFENEAVFIKPEVQPGHRIWWKETWKIVGWNEEDNELTLRYPGTNSESITVQIPEEWDPEGEKFNTYWQQCTDDMIKAGIQPDESGIYLMSEDTDEKTIPTRNRSSMLMPRWAARFTNDVIAVRPERLHSITEADAIAEGIHFCEEDGYWYADDAACHKHSARGCYLQLWAQLNGWESMEANPWLWVYTMKP